MTEQHSAFISSAKTAACFFCVLTLLLGALPWLVYGIFDNLSYNRYTGRVIKVSEFAPARNIFNNGVPVNTAEGTYEYFTKSGGRRQGSFTVFDWENDGGDYKAGDEYIVYTHEGWSGDIREYSALSRMRDNILYPLIFVIPALIAAFLCGAKAGGFWGLLTVREMFPKSFIFSVSASLLSGAVMVYILFIWENDAMFFAGIAALFARLEAIAVCIIAIIAEIIVWNISIRREKKKIINL